SATAMSEVPRTPWEAKSSAAVSISRRRVSSWLWRRVNRGVGESVVKSGYTTVSDCTEVYELGPQSGFQPEVSGGVHSGGRARCTVGKGRRGGPAPTQCFAADCSDCHGLWRSDLPITSTILDVALDRPDQPALVGAEDRLSYGELVEDSRVSFAVVDSLHRAQPAPPMPAVETQGIAITAASTASASFTARLIAGLAGFRAVSATIDPRWPLEHQIGVIGTTGIGLVISDSPALAEALADAGWTGTVISPAAFA